MKVRLFGVDDRRFGHPVEKSLPWVAFHGQTECRIDRQMDEPEYFGDVANEYPRWLFISIEMVNLKAHYFLAQSVQKQYFGYTRV